MNVYSFTGRLARDCETRFTQGGMAICSFTVAVDYGFGDNKGTNWIRCSIFGKRAESRLPQYLVKGTQVAISGELKVRDYNDNEGNKRTSVEVNVGELDLLGGKGESESPRQSHSENLPSHGGSDNARRSNDPFASAPDFGDVPVDDDIPF